jgi:hypothetical protein
LQFHLQDSHGAPLAREHPERKRRREEREGTLPTKAKRQRREYRTEPYEGGEIKTEYNFINLTMESVSGRRKVKTKSGHDIPADTGSVTTQSSTYDEYQAEVSASPKMEESIQCKTPRTSVCSDDLIDPALLSVEALPDIDAIEIVDLSTVDSFEPPSCRQSMAESSFNAGFHI